MEENIKSSKLVLHTCCAVCGAHLCELLKNDFSEILIYFYNPNVHPKEEYEKRKEAGKKLAEIYSLEFVEGEYDDKNWFELVRGLENEPEGGARCPICFEMRLKKTVQLAKERGFTHFATTLAASPYKSEKIVDELAGKIAREFGLEYLSTVAIGALDKKEIWQKTRELAKKFNFYHQNYCGCLFSQRKSI
ncbi:MAG TPA: epoxyqueuosine reductase QueH [Candidatus Paceibacterota bacterium]|nr:epoxyqueuosine reductase QueH [Candidatus Paceibacterota bacterium]